MNSHLISSLIHFYPILNNQSLHISALGEGLIHETLLIDSESKQWVVQGFNESVFNFPDRIDFNLSLLSAHAKAQTEALPFLLPLPILNKEGMGLSEIGGKKYRLFDFVKGKTLQQIENSNQAFLAAEAYGEFAKWAKEISGELMQETIPGFHRLDLRFQKLEQASLKRPVIASEEREILEFYLSQKPLIDWYLNQLNQLPSRVTHNDTKINNLIFFSRFDKGGGLGRSRYGNGRILDV
ncbi:phosphotransferase [Algoriphagus boritolerans]|uniref:phosphotransferase n=1 Tax=Algoriphagus boritolerans TaxID=308111 RepID=UPI000AF4882C